MIEKFGLWWGAGDGRRVHSWSWYGFKLRAQSDSGFSTFLSPTTMTDVNELVNTLNVPDRIKNIQNAGDPALHEWRSDASRSLASLQKYISSTQSLPPELVALIATTLVPLQLDAPYTTEDIRDQAFGMLSVLFKKSDLLLTQSKLLFNPSL